ncbi:phosphatase PAP2 family protein [Desulfosporosinus nitroreducens]|uniref:Phosphatase PAP2 family protein n=1 Tax=Desulfosporosinus nitroreducens TaxID=2018668 RepID=A0ABT8QX43_9FIRM|nr:phosphatase PAP2 family protein [Desulfosporosinus nitroreducens]MCO1603530.1 phosphatase PAP2 family protein [Desulfosporosinus nitroreducens]MDO0825924.1 phosphatase PAP2 family protein [Desulfosporosinus nitroreducens]
MQKIIKNLMPLFLMLSIPISNIIYVLLNNANRGTHSLVTDLDQGVPFLKIFVLPYLSWYFFIFGTLTFFCFKDKKIYYRTLLAINLGLLISYGIYFFFQTNVQRPDLVGNDFLTMLIAFVYNNDQPFNAFPSIHVLLSFLMIKAINRYPAKNYLNVAIVYITAILIILATQFIKQHVILDLLSSIVLGGLIFDLVFYVNMEGLRAWLKEPYLWSMVKKRSEI